jgi:hypothetical protein
MQIPKPTTADKQNFEALVPGRPEVTIKPMFGNLGAFVNGNMFMGLFGSSVGVKLPHSECAALLAVEGSGPFGPSDRPMGGYVSLPPEWSGAEAQPWVTKALEYVAGLPPKAPKGKQ